MVGSQLSDSMRAIANIKGMRGSALPVERRVCGMEMSYMSPPHILRERCLEVACLVAVLKTTDVACEQGNCVSHYWWWRGGY